MCYAMHLLCDARHACRASHMVVYVFCSSRAGPTLKHVSLTRERREAARCWTIPRTVPGPVAWAGYTDPTRTCGPHCSHQAGELTTSIKIKHPGQAPENQQQATQCTLGTPSDHNICGVCLLIRSIGKERQQTHTERANSDAYKNTSALSSVCARLGQLVHLIITKLVQRSSIHQCLS